MHGTLRILRCCDENSACRQPEVRLLQERTTDGAAYRVALRVRP
jgi:glutamine synthetase adenylyltransferase